MRRSSWFPMCLVVFSSLLLGACITDSDDAKVTLDGELTYGYDDFDFPTITGAIKNVGKQTLFNCSVDFTVYDGNTILEVASGYPADLGDIEPGESANFEATFTEIESHDDYDRIKTKIDCLSY